MQEAENETIYFPHIFNVICIWPVDWRIKKPTTFIVGYLLFYRTYYIVFCYYMVFAVS